VAVPAGERKLLWSVLIVVICFMVVQGLLLARLGARVNALEQAREAMTEGIAEPTPPGWLASPAAGHDSTMERIGEFCVEQDIDPSTAAVLRQQVEASEARLQELPARVERGEISDVERIELLEAEMARRHEAFGRIVGAALADELHQRLTNETMIRMEE